MPGPARSTASTTNVSPAGEATFSSLSCNTWWVKLDDLPGFVAEEPKKVEILENQTVEVVFDLGGWVPIDAVLNTTRTLLSGDVAAQTAGGRLPPADRSLPIPHSATILRNRPLAVSFAYGEGTVVYTSFHNEAQAGQSVRHILEYFTILE
jgi:hypothetical protein